MINSQSSLFSILQTGFATVLIITNSKGLRKSFKPSDFSGVVVADVFSNVPWDVPHAISHSCSEIVPIQRGKPLFLVAAVSQLAKVNVKFDVLGAAIKL